MRAHDEGAVGRWASRRFRAAALVLTCAASVLVHGVADASPPDPSRADAAALRGSFGLSLVDLPGLSSVAIDDDARALFANPAGIDRSVPLGYFLAWEDGRQGTADQATAGLTAGPFGLGYEQVRPEGSRRYSRWIFGLGGASRAPASFGVRAIREHQGRVGPDENAWRWDAGLLWRPSRAFSFGLTGTDLNQDRMFNELHRRAYTLGIAARPLPFDQRSRVTLFSDLSGGEEQRWRDEARLSAGLSVEPVAGLEISGSVAGPLKRFQDQTTVRLAVGIHRQKTSSWVGRRLDKPARHLKFAQTRLVFALHGTTVRQRTLQEPPVLARIRMQGNYGDESQHGLEIPIPFVGSQSYSSIRPILRSLDRAEQDRDVRGVLLELGHVSCGALSSEVRAAIQRVRAKGKPVVAYSDEISGLGQYHIAAACDRIVLDSAGWIERFGYRADMLYYGEMLDSAGVQFEKVAHGKYKTAGEQLVLSRASEGMRESINSILDDRLDLLRSDMAADRNLPRAKVDDLSDGRLFEGKEACAAGLVDTLGTRDDAWKLLARLSRVSESTKPIGLSGRGDRAYAWTDGPKVAVLWLDGGITGGRSGGGFLSENTMGSETVVETLRGLKGRKDVQAVVLRIDSPGGSGLASDQIWRAVAELQKEGKKVVASMSRVAGSGGYYIACGADEIYADPMTITGSIGVLAIRPNLADFYRRHRIGVETFERGRMMGMYSGAVPLTAEERAHLADYIDRFYEHFLSRVAVRRPLTRDQIDSVGQGRIWTGRQALERKLIDHVGGLHDAVARAREVAGLPEDAQIVHLYRPRGGFLRRALEGGAASAEMAALTSALASRPESTPTDPSGLLDLWVAGKLRTLGMPLGSPTGPLLIHPLLDRGLDSE